MSSVTAGMPQLDVVRKDRLEMFAPYVAPLPWFTIDILHKLYINIYLRHNKMPDDYRIRAITCSDILFSPGVSKVSYNVFMFRPEVQEELRGIINPQKVILDDIGIFMLAYMAECRPHFLGLKYIESFRIEANLIQNPSAEANRISSHIMNRLNQISSFEQKRNTVAYYLNVLEKSDMGAEEEELVRYLKGYGKYDKQSGQIPEEWKQLKNKESEADKGITIKLPLEVREQIIAEIQKAKPSATKVQTFHALFIGINQYSDSSTDPLDGAAQDARNMAEYMKSNPSGKFKYYANLLLDEQATKAGVLSAINDVCQQAEEGDIVFFYFAGYGGNETASGDMQEMMNQNVMITPPKDQPVLICHDTLPGSNPALGMNEVIFAFSKLPKECQSVFMLDCGFQLQTYSGNFKTRSLRENVKMRRPDQWIVNDDSTIPLEMGWGGYTIYAADEYENVYETPEGGLFTSSLLEALKENQNNITYEDLLKEVKAAAVVDEMASPRIVPNGNFFMDRPFLFGFLKEGENVEKRLVWAAETKAEKLDLSGLQLTQIPAAVFEMPLLKELNLSNNQITEIPEQIDFLLNLKELDISGNPISRINDAVGKLENLVTFKAQRCGLKVFPYMLLNCKNILRIDLQTNDIKWVPVEIKEFHPDAQVVMLENQVLNLPQDYHLSTMGRLKTYLSGWEIKPVSHQHVALIIGMDYENTLAYLKEEMNGVQKILLDSGVDAKTIFNPTAEELYRFLYEHQEQMTILHIGAYRMDRILVSVENVRDVNDKDFAELFKCIRRSKYAAKMVFLNYCYSNIVANELIPDTFSCAIGTDEMIDDRSAMSMSNLFYNGLSRGQQLEESYANSTLDKSISR